MHSISLACAHTKCSKWLQWPLQDSHNENNVHVCVNKLLLTRCYLHLLGPSSDSCMHV